MAPKKRPCGICRRWFEPHPRAGERQRVCSERACQRERHRRADNAWHARNPNCDRKRRLKERLGVEPPEAPADDPLGGLDWDVAERAIGPAHRVVVEVTARLIVGWAQDAVTAKGSDEAGELDPLPRPDEQDAVPAKAKGERGYPDRLRPAERKTQSDRGPPLP